MARFFFFIFLLMGFSKLGYARPIEFSSQLSVQAKNIIKDDFAMDLTLIDNADLEILLGVTDLNDKTLKNWLTARVGYILGENDDIGFQTVVLQTYSYPNFGILPEVEEPNPPNATNIFHQDDSIIAKNVGAQLYYDGKVDGRLIGYRFKSIEEEKILEITSPRVGLVQIGNLFFQPINKLNPQSIVNKWSRIAALFNVARHSDGNGKSLGFFEAICPKGSVYYNYNACDREANGPYSIEVQILKQVRATCLGNNTCSSTEAAALSTLVADRSSRVLTKNNLDPLPEGKN